VRFSICLSFTTIDSKNCLLFFAGNGNSIFCSHREKVDLDWLQTSASVIQGFKTLSLV
jgi:hypothetical protein